MNRDRLYGDLSDDEKAEVDEIVKQNAGRG